MEIGFFFIHIPYYKASLTEKTPYSQALLILVVDGCIGESSVLRLGVYDNFENIKITG